MCVGDIKLAKQMKSSSVYVVVESTDSLIVPSSPHRVGLIFAPPGGGNVRLMFDRAAQLSRGVYLEPSSQPFQLTLFENGDLVTREWRGICNSGSTTIVVFETFLNMEHSHYGQEDRN